ncbi:MAG: DUF2490 domain-containing protein [Bacteroidetes bacterium]|nr:DUF2490 domain-containing protein [Bacteroidota bacterium]
MKIIYGIIFLLSINMIAWGQSNVSSGLLPRINLSVELAKGMKLNNSIESRQVILRSLEEDIKYEFILTDLAAVISLKTTANTSFNGGYQLRLLNKFTLHRFIQQFNIISIKESVRLAHRIGTDQTFGKDLPMEFRTRYRLTIEIPLNGTRIDPGEFYLKMGNEILWAIQSNQSDIEFRITPKTGYLFPKSNKLEAGIDYRFNEFVESAIDHDFWISITWFQTINRKRK